MGLIKAAVEAAKFGIGDQFKEFIDCPQVENDVIIQRGVVHHGEGNENYSANVISNGSTIAVPQGMAMMIIDNGKVVEKTNKDEKAVSVVNNNSKIYVKFVGSTALADLKIKTKNSPDVYNGTKTTDNYI